MVMSRVLLDDRRRVIHDGILSRRPHTRGYPSKLLTALDKSVRRTSGGHNQIVTIQLCGDLGFVRQEN
jgi:hypothetical protein